MLDATVTNARSEPGTARAAIAVHGVSKRFQVPHERPTLKQRLLQPSLRADVGLTALDGVTFEVRHGEIFGVVGKNGCGKSTLLRCIAGIYRPDAGAVSVDGRLGSFIELGVGFNPELAAGDNVLLSSMLFGLTRQQAQERFEDILAFAELEAFRDLPLKHYSSGMTSRLGFAILAHVDAQVLLFDEVFAVGDGAFRSKCEAHFERLRDEGRAIVLVSHDMEVVRRFCDRALLLQAGRIVALGAPEDVTDAYTQLNAGNEISAPPLEEAAAPSFAPPPHRERNARRVLALARILAESEFKLKYAGTTLSYVWAIARPAALFGVLLAIFTALGRFSRGIEHYPVYLLSSVVLWTYFTQVTAGSLRSLWKRASILRKQPLPHIAMPVSVALAGLYDLALSAAVVLAVALGFGIAPQLSWLEVPLLVVLLVLFTEGLSLLLAGAFVRHRDMEQIWNVANQALFYLTPIFYVASSLPDPFDRVVVLANPLATIFTEMRHAFVDPTAPSAADVAGSAVLLLVPVAVTAALLAAGLIVFRRESPRAAEHL